MRDPEDAIDEAYGSWLGSSGYADMKSYRDVFRDGWNAGREHEARNCPQEGRIAALKGEITDLQEQFDMYEASLHVEEETVKELRQVLAKAITFTCTECGDMFEEPVQAFADTPGDSVMAPTLCRDCGHGED